MPRPTKQRAVCGLPRFSRFLPLDNLRGGHGAVIMTVDEYEAFRLIEGEGLTQQECSEQMQVSRTTVQAIRDRASRKIADCLVNGKELIIEGGMYRVCRGRSTCLCARNCPRRGTLTLQIDIEEEAWQERKGSTMRIAVPVQEDGQTISETLGRAPRFALVEGQTIRYVDNKAAESQGGAGIKAAQQLVDLNVEVVLAPQCGVNAAEVLTAAGIGLFQTQGDSLVENLKAHDKDGLERLTEAIPSVHTPKNN